MLGWFRKQPAPAEHFADYRSWTVVASSNLSSVAFFEGRESTAGNVLGVRFRSGAEYHYMGVPRGVYLALLAAPSKGTYLDRHVKKGGYPYRKVA